MLDDEVTAIDVVTDHSDVDEAVLRLLAFGVRKVHRTAEGDSGNEGIICVSS